MKFGNGLLLLMTKSLQVRHFNPHCFFFFNGNFGLYI